jgi:hypothetical protein
VHAHIHPSYVWFTAPLASGSVYHLHRAQSLVWCHRPSHHCTESPFAPLGCYPAEGRVPQPRPALPGPPCYSGLMRQTSSLSRPTHYGLVRESLQVAACPCWEEALPDVVSSISVEVLGPVPRRASAVPLPVSSRRTSASPYVQEVRRADTPAMMATSMPNRLRGCSHSVMCRLPHVLDPQGAPTAEAQRPLGSRAVYTTPCTWGYPPRTVVSLRACIGPWARRDLHPLD